jgi:hypothetical protein
MAPIAQDVAWRLKLAGPVKVVVSQVRDEDEYSLWMRRYHQLLSMISANVQKSGQWLKVSEWDLVMKADFLPLDEISLPDGRMFHQLQSKRKLSRQLRDEFLSQVREFAAEYGLTLQHPETEET